MKSTLYLTKYKGRREEREKGREGKEEERKDNVCPETTRRQIVLELSTRVSNLPTRIVHEWFKTWKRQIVRVHCSRPVTRYSSVLDTVNTYSVPSDRPKGYSREGRTTQNSQLSRRSVSYFKGSHTRGCTDLPRSKVNLDMELTVSFSEKYTSVTR